LNKLAVVLVLLFSVVALDMGREALVSLGFLDGEDAPVSPVPELSSVPLLKARKGKLTRQIASSYKSRGDAPLPPRNQFKTIRFPSGGRELIAYLSPNPHTAGRRPALLWAHEGFGGIGAEIWAPQSPLISFLKAGMVVFVPAWRGENDNPGQFELFFGEVMDAVAAVQYLGGLSYVDPKRIYMVGIGSGGTLTMLTALATARLRGAFAIGGTPDLARIMKDGKGYGNTPFPYALDQEVFLRSPIHFAKHLQTPTFFFAARKGPTAPDARRMERLSREAPAPFTAILLKGSQASQQRKSLCKFVSRKILLDTGASPIRFTSDEVQLDLNPPGK
jgi:dienelactone hydrolase